MKRISLLFSLLIVCSVNLMQAQATVPKPEPALKQLHRLVGHWTYTSEQQATPLGPAGKVSGEFDNRMILGGFFLKYQMSEKGPSGNAHCIEIVGYDSVNKQFTATGYWDDGGIYSGTSTFSGNTLVIAGKVPGGGRQYPYRSTIAFAADWMSAMQKGEISTDDGKTWILWFEEKWTKVKPAAKK
jgi:hypothetical protein